MVDQATRTQDETIQTRIGIVCLDTVEQTSDHIVSTGSLTTRQDYTHIHSGLCLAFVALLESNHRHTIGVREQFLDLFLIGY